MFLRAAVKQQLQVHIPSSLKKFYLKYVQTGKQRTASCDEKYIMVLQTLRFDSSH